MFWVQVAELDPCVRGGELPVHGSLICIGGFLPATELVIEGVDVGYPAARSCYEIPVSETGVS